MTEYGREQELPERHKNRPFLCIYFRCCSIYQRIYLNKDGTAFVGWCPRCMGKVQVDVSPDGSSSKFFVAQ